MNTLAVIALAAVVPGCHAVNMWAFGDPSVEDINVQDVTYNKSQVHGYYEDGTPKKNIPTYDVVFEVCGAAPAMTETTKYLSFAVLTGDDKDNRIALWDVRP